MAAGLLLSWRLLLLQRTDVGGVARGRGRGDIRRGTCRAGPGPGGGAHPVHVGHDGLLLGALDVTGALSLGLGVVTTVTSPGAGV